jgi:hypothetical protein
MRLRGRYSALRSHFSCKDSAMQLAVAIFSTVVGRLYMAFAVQ